MRINICAIGRARQNASAVLYKSYAKRLPWEVKTFEVETRKSLKGTQLVIDEGKLLRATIPQDSKVIALDRKGSNLSSKAFAHRLGHWRDDGIGDLAFVIGGANGLHPDLTENADFILSLGSMTWPHMLARVMLIEQIYRAYTILTRHPYHRA